MSSLSATQISDFRLDIADTNSAFSDAEIQRLYTRAGTYEGAVVLAFEQLIAAGVAGDRFIKYTANETSEDRQAAFDHLYQLKEMWKAKVDGAGTRQTVRMVRLQQPPDRWANAKRRTRQGMYGGGDLNNGDW